VAIGIVIEVEEVGCKVAEIAALSPLLGKAACKILDRGSGEGEAGRGGRNGLRNVNGELGTATVGGGEKRGLSGQGK